MGNGIEYGISHRMSKRGCTTEHTYVLRLFLSSHPPMVEMRLYAQTAVYETREKRDLPGSLCERGSCGWYSCRVIMILAQA